MKRFCLLLTLFSASFQPSRAQCVVYACDRTGAWGMGYNQLGHEATMRECEESAAKKCKDNGGMACKSFYKSAKGGWCAFMAGKTQNDPKVYMAISDNNTTQKQAEDNVKKKYVAMGGPYPDQVKINSWYVYTKLAK